MGSLTPLSKTTRQNESKAPVTFSSFPQGSALMIGDMASLILVYIMILPLQNNKGFDHGEYSPIIWGCVWLLWRAYYGLYPGYGRSPQTELRLHVVGTIQITAIHLIASFAVQGYVKGVVINLFYWLLIIISSLLARYFIRHIMIRLDKFGRPISIIGAGQTAQIAISHLKSHPSYGLNPIAAYDDNTALHGGNIQGVPILGPLSLALSEPRTEQALISMPGVRAELQQRIVNAIYAVFPYTWVIPDLFGVPNQALQPHNIGSVASLEIKNNLRSVQSRAMKRTIDLVGSGVGGLFILPVLLIIAILIKIDSPGPAVYRARRLGRDGRPFDCFKFRSMHRDAEEKLISVLNSDPVLRAEYEATHKLKNDPRVTRLGRFLRSTSLDELPQLANVFLGTMSLVGPRPIVQGEVEKYGAIYAVYKQVRPGMTGYWQANGRSDTSYDERVGMDYFYVTNWTPWLDMIVLIQTIRVVLLGKGAY